MPMPPVCLTIGCTDPSGAGHCAADLKTWTVRGLYGTAVIAGVVSAGMPGPGTIHPLPVESLRDQLACLPPWLEVSAVKVGLLPGPQQVLAVHEWLTGHPGIPLVVDPVFANPLGIPLVGADTIRRVRDLLLPRASLAVLNRFEAAWLVGRDECLAPEDMQAAAADLFAANRCPVLVTGGSDGTQSVDVLCGMDGHSTFQAPLLDCERLLGAGCTLSAAIAGELARGEDLRGAISEALSCVGAMVARARVGFASPRGVVVLCHGRGL